MLTESAEDYLETIYRLAESQGYVRAVEVAEALGVGSSSVTRMVRRLYEAGFIRYAKYRNIALTPQGRKYGRFLVWRDRTLRKFLRLLRTETEGQGQAEGIEHYVTPPTMGLFRNLLEYFSARPDALREVRDRQQSPAYPEGEDLSELLAWISQKDR